VDRCDIYSYPDPELKTWLAIADLADGDEISASFVVPWPLNPDDPRDEERCRRLDRLFWSGCRVSASVDCA
jgi:hypothetical protein